MLQRATFPVVLGLAVCTAIAQAPLVQQGAPFTKSLKGSTGDLFTVVDGIFAKDGRHILYVEEGLTPKVVRLDEKLLPTEELVLKDVLVDGIKWTAIAPINRGNDLHCLMVSSTKKESHLGLGTITSTGALALESVRLLTTFDLPYMNDPGYTMVVRPMPDPILFSRGLAYVQQERLISSPDGSRYLLNHHSHKGKGNKRISFACLDNAFGMQWEGSLELPVLDTKSTIHQIALGNDGTIYVLSYLFQCKSDEQLGDKNCHELHLSIITGQGSEARHVLLEKGFVSSARLLERTDGRVAVALRYGALTGIPGIILSFDPNDPKLKPSPVASQRLPSIRKAKLLAFGDPAADPGKPLSRGAKVPNDIVALLHAADGGMVVVETYMDPAFQLPVGDAIALRTLNGHLRISHLTSTDSIGWQKEFSRALMTTAGQPYQGAVVMQDKTSNWLFFGQTPKGYGAILRSGVDAAASRSGTLSEPQVLRAARVSNTGEVLQEGTVLLMDDDFVPCPMGIILEPGGDHGLVKQYDRGTGYRFALVDLSKVGD